jgi:hypothetical protein
VPALLRIRGYRFYFYSLEAREPPHIHVAHAGRYAKFWLEPVGLAQNRGFRGHELTEINRLVVEHAGFFREKWHEYFGRPS